MKTNSLNVKTLLKEINYTAKMLQKNNIFEDYGMNPQDNMQGMEQMPQEGSEEMGYDEGMEANEPQAPSQETVSVINQIRELAIQGIAQYANNVESEEYQALKKIWLLTDKFYESAMDEEDGKKKSFS